MVKVKVKLSQFSVVMPFRCICLLKHHCQEDISGEWRYSSTYS